MRFQLAACVSLALASSAYSQSLAIGGFTTARGGVFAIQGGGVVAGFRASIVGAFPGTTYSGAPVLTADYLSSIDILFISSAFDGNTAIAPLSAAEIAAVRAFVNHGGAAILFADNSTFSGAASDPANESVVDAFGIDVTGTGSPWAQPVTVLNPAATPLTNGPYGVVSSWNVGWSGWFNAVPASGTVVANVNESSLPGAVFFPRHALAACSGGVLALSDSTQVSDGYFSAGNSLDVLLRNAVAYLSASSCVVGLCGDINGDGMVDGADLGALLAGWGTANIDTDLDANGIVDGADLGILLGNWGDCD